MSLNKVTICLLDNYAWTNNQNTVPFMERRLQRAISDIEQWTIQHGFTIANDKPVTVWYQRNRGMPGKPRLALRHHNIAFEGQKKLLGLIYDQRLQWREHVEHLRKKCIKGLELLKVLSYSEWGADRQARLRVYCDNFIIFPFNILY